LYAFFSPHACYMPFPSHPPWFCYPNNISWGIQVTKLLIMQSSPASCHFFPLRSKYSRKWHKLQSRVYPSLRRSI
jgi:hypothetical protein